MRKLVKHWKLLILISTILACSAGWMLSGMGGKAWASGDELVPPDAPPLPVSVVRLGSIGAPNRGDDYRGTIQASKEADLAFRRNGPVKSIRVEEGDHVNCGDLLAELDISDIEASVRGMDAQIAEATAVLSELEAGPREQTIAAAKAMVRELEAAAELARLNLKRESSLKQTVASSEQAFDEARITALRSDATLDATRENLNELLAGARVEQVSAQRARVNSLRAQRESLDVQISDSKIVAPFDAIVARRNLDEGTIVGPDRVVLRLLQIDPLEARFGIAPADASRLRVGQKVMLQIQSSLINGVVARIEPDLDRATRTQGVHVVIVNETGELSDRLSGSREFPKPATGQTRVVPGQTVSLAIPKNVDPESIEYWLPVQALSRSTRGLWSVMVVANGGDEEWVVERRDVQVLETDSELARISGGLVSTGDLVIADAIHRVTPGMKVEPLESGVSSFAEKTPSSSKGVQHVSGQNQDLTGAGPDVN